MSKPAPYAVSAASGQLGRLIVAGLAQRVGPEAVVALVRDPQRAAGLFPAGVEIRKGDYEQQETLEAALSGVHKLVLVSSNMLGHRTAQHRNVVEAAVRTGVGRILYTSVLNAGTSRLGVAEEHRQTEALLKASGLAWSLLRNGWYTENYTASIPAALQHGVLIGSAGAGRIASAPRQDYADAAIAVVLRDEAPKTVHELAGDQAYTLAEFAAELSRQTGRTIPYVDLPQAEYRGALLGAGLPDGLADLLADSDASAAQGALFDESGALGRLIGRATGGLEGSIAAALAA
jgi:NAD(P)H dehydrogenase (quinone)